ncbi:MAG TPA: HPr family phosphocarrier protein [Tissierellaceae bacterium]|nr:HPr family phosphocarrier protein [Tissierellaceae bacterium]
MCITIRLTTEADIIDFVTLTRTFESPIDLIKYHHCVDAKSIMGVIALGAYEDVNVSLISANEDEILRFHKDMMRFKV